MSPYLPKAVIATEDRRFYSHFGIDPIGLVRAAAPTSLPAMSCRAAARSPSNWQRSSSSHPSAASRKIRETMLALWLEHRFTKNQILEIYLNRVYLGAGTYGVDAAAHRYFGKSAPN